MARKLWLGYHPDTIPVGYAMIARSLRRCWISLWLVFTWLQYALAAVIFNKGTEPGTIGR